MFYMQEWLKGNKMYLLIVILVAVTIGIYFLVPSEKDVTEDALSDDWLEENGEPFGDRQNVQEKEQSSEEKERIMVDVKGAVASPGVYKAFAGDRVQDLINQAGGLLDTADQHSINFAMRVADEMVLYIPVIGDNSSLTEEVQGSMTSVTASAGKSLVNINSASDTELQVLPGVGPSKAAAIIEYRETNGRFRSIEDLMEISGIGEKTFEKLKEHITVN